MIRRPPSSPLFPYPTLSQSRRLMRQLPPQRVAEAGLVEPVADMAVEVAIGAFGRAERSEEHTSELQSRQYLVCRLLLEKKTNNYPTQFVKESLLHHLTTNDT